MRHHTAVKASAARHEAFLLGFVQSSNEPHVFAHAVSRSYGLTLKAYTTPTQAQQHASNATDDSKGDGKSVLAPSIVGGR